ncbi:MAG: PHP domain-containing protein [Clostridia bacterium]|nr:PHP domain-containing protein [Clostridia bacterium]
MLKINGDLHIHTNYSDGSLSPGEILDMAKERQLSVISITDHNTISGVEEAVQLGKVIGIEVIPGIELSIEYKTEMHLLGYCFDIYNKDLSQYINSKKEWEFSELIKFIRKVRKKINNISIDDFLSINTINVRTIADVMIEKGYAKDRYEIFKNFFENVDQLSINKIGLSPREGIKLINDAGGLSVLAHPTRLGCSYQELYDILIELKEFGLSGLECYHKCHSLVDVREFIRIANELNLIITGGSDFHSIEDSNANNQDLDVSNFEFYFFGQSYNTQPSNTFLRYII